jgi:hypothetical protein
MGTRQPDLIRALLALVQQALALAAAPTLDAAWQGQFDHVQREAQRAEHEWRHATREE